jgi:colanic acid/amylovoran biosynthesis protein
MAILSLGAGVPVFPIAYEFKTQELFKKLGCGHWTVDIEEIESQSLIQSVDSFLNSIPETCKTLFPAVKQEREQAWESSSLVKNFFEEWQRIHNC